MIQDGIHISNIFTKVNGTVGFVRPKLYSSPQDVKDAAFKE